MVSDPSSEEAPSATDDPAPVSLAEALRTQECAAGWRRDAFAQYLEDCAGKAVNVPTSLLRAILSAPTKLGDFFRQVIRNGGGKNFNTFDNDEAVPTLGGGRERDLLPLPYDPAAGEAAIPPLLHHRTNAKIEHRRAWVLLMILTLNFQYMGQGGSVHGPPSKSQALAIGLLGQAADILLERNDVVINGKDWASELRMRKVGYEGEEVGLPLALTWSQVEPGLPSLGVAASLDATRFATGEVLRVLEDPGRLLLPESEWEQAPRKCRIWCDSEEDFEELAEGLVKRGILEEVDE